MRVRNFNKDQFYVNKTGFELFDAIRAYGLGIMINGIRHENSEVTLKDIGHAYLLEVEGELPEKPDEEIFAIAEKKSMQIFRTFKVRKDAKKGHPKDEVKEIVLKNFEKILALHKNLDFVPEIGSRVKEGKVLYQTLEVSASKGFREEKRGTAYHEGTQLQVDKYSWAIAVLGAAHFISWKETADFIMTLIPNPIDVYFYDHRGICRELEKESLCTFSATTVLTHYALKLTKQITKRKEAPLVRYDSVIFNVMQKTGQQPKPGGGGKFSLDFLEKLSRSPQGIDILERLEELFPISSKIKSVKQDIAFATAEFLIRPSFENFRRWESLYIRGRIKEDLPLWDKVLLEEILKNVEAA